MTTVCLNMIVKNESNIIERMFDSVIDFIDTYCICDTGSTDDTIQKIETYFNKRNIKGKLVVEEFKNFEYNRNFAIEQARDMADYILLMDADMLLTYKPNFNKETFLKEKAYLILQGSTAFNYYNFRLFHNDIAVKCVGYTHEYYDVKTNTIKCDDLFIQDIGDGGCKENKYKRDIELLKLSIAENKDLCRSNFYLANTYRESGNNEDAIKCYEYVLEHQTWQEELFMSCLYMGQCFKNIGEDERAVAIWLYGYNVCPSRVETLYELIKFYKDNRNYELCLMFYKTAITIESPQDCILFIRRDIYDHLLHHEFVIFGYYLLSRYPMLFLQILPTIKYLLLNESFESKYNLLDNYSFYKQYTTVDDMHSIINISCDLNGYNNSTPSIAKYSDDKYLMNLRMVNYDLIDNNNYISKDHDGRIRTKNICFLLDKDFKQINKHLFEDSDADEDKMIYGIEDARLINIGNDVYYTGTVSDPFTKKLMISHGRYSIEDKTISKKLLFHDNNNYCEKNWVMFEENGELKIIYSWSPLIIGRVEGNSFIQERKIETPDVFSYFRGSTNGVLIANALCFITHLVIMKDNKRQYYHCFVTIDPKEFKLIDISLPFTFSRDSNIEYCLGLLQDGDDLIITYSLNDNCSRILKVPIVEFKKRVFLN